ncbi:hypothetical protein [Stenotrophomonas sp. AB1(2024)]|uniref:hypothetical protein n=1 Tax=Stenotrophomonas sp. AB1(2024) TaxID=3132215 RepID=UPI003099BADA
MALLSRGSSDVNAGTTAMVLLMVLLAGCQRESADISAVHYRVVDEARQRGQCRFCVAPVPDARCEQGGGHAAEARWHLPAATEGKHLRIKAVRMGDDIFEMPIAGPTGRAMLSLTLQPDDRIVLVDADALRELVFIRITESIGCDLRSPGVPSR